MYFVYKLILVILLLYLALSGLNAIPLLIDRHKIADSSDGAPAAPDAAASGSDDDTNIGTSNSNTATTVSSSGSNTTADSASSSSSSPFQEWLPTNGGVNYNDNGNRSRNDKTENIRVNDPNDDNHSNHYRHRSDNIDRSSDSGNSDDKRHSKISDTASISNRLGNKTTIAATTAQTTTTKLTSEATTNSPQKHERTMTYFRSDRESPASLANYFHYDVEAAAGAPDSVLASDLLSSFKKPAAHPPSSPSSSPAPDGDEEQDEINQNSMNNSDAERFLLKYDSDDGKKCLLDDIKEYFMWWSHTNGTLKMTNLNYTGQHLYLDLSFRNITSDDHLYKKARALTYIKGREILAFSAAQNNLTTVPYHTLALMNSTLRYLTLKGNLFASEIHALNRIMNDTNRHPEGPNSNEPDSNICDDCEYTDSETDSHVEDNNTANINSNTRNNYTHYESHFGSHPKKSPYYKKIFGKNEESIAWATFPKLPALLELDISNCHIEYVTKHVFQNFSGLRRLFIAHNKMLTIPSDTFRNIQALEYLDLSFTNVLDFDYELPLPTLEAVINLIYGVKIHQTTFKYLPNLVYLDLSHTKLTRNSAVAFTHLSERLKYLSLCYTAFPMIGNALFKNTAMVGLDLSGNPYAAYNIIDDAFEGVADSLKYLYFEGSNIKDLAWLRCLENLRVLGLSGNNINSVSLETFSSLRSLQMLDLSSNHVGNWYNRAFSHNGNLRMLNLRDNNINIINLEMLKDFQTLDYLSLGDNNFVCDCLLRDLVDIAAANNNEAECSRNVLQDAQQKLVDNMERVYEYISRNATLIASYGYSALKMATSASAGPGSSDIDISGVLMKRYLSQLQSSYLNMKTFNQHRLKLRFVARYLNAVKANISDCQPTESMVFYDTLNGSTLKFQLLDYEEEHYWCFNETKRMNFVQLNCQSRSFDADIAQQLTTITKYVVGTVSAVVGLSLIGVLLYLKRWHIHYYYSSLKSAALVSVATKETVDKFNTLADHDPSLVYDIFISYCQNDREWVLEELLPNVEEAGHISICMHERDFQIGLTILDNIISCMDRSRALMLIISTNFLLSHWCQFEMHLAQHRIFEVSKEHLIIVFLEDIPRNKRPKTLQYLMDVKTYIKWPTGKGNKQPKPEERKLFWRRLKRSLENIGTDGAESRA